MKYVNAMLEWISSEEHISYDSFGEDYSFHSVILKPIHTPIQSGIYMFVHWACLRKT